MSRLELLDLAGDHFLELVALTDDVSWDRATPCEDWNVGQLVDHVIGGNRFTAEILGGATAADALAATKASFAEMTDRPAAVRASLSAQAHAFSTSGALDRICHHVAGDMPGKMVLGFRLTDLTVHGWDLARVIGADDTIPHPLVEAVWNNVRRTTDQMAGSGLFGDGPSATLPEDADLQARLIDATGRRG